MSRVPYRTLASALFVCILAPAAAPHDGAKFEPPDGKVLHGAGQRNTNDPSVLSGEMDAGLVAYVDAIDATTNGIHPLITRFYYTIYERETHEWYTEQHPVPKAQHWDDIVATKLDPLEAWLDELPEGMMPEISISFANEFEADVPALMSIGELDDEIDRMVDILRCAARPMFIRIGYEQTENGKYIP